MFQAFVVVKQMSNLVSNRKGEVKYDTLSLYLDIEFYFEKRDEKEL